MYLGICVLCIILQVMASKTKIYIILEFVDGGELFDKIVRHSSSRLRVLYLLGYESFF